MAKQGVCAEMVRRFTLQMVMWLGTLVLWELIFTIAFTGNILQYPTPTHWTVTLLYLLVWHYLWLMTVLSLFSAVLTPPPEIPKAYRVPSELSGQGEEYEQVARGQRPYWHLCKERKLPVRCTAIVKINQTDMPCKELELVKYCDRCKIVKPERVHHCSRCGLCTARMDHHCPILGVCVHYGSHKQFILFIGYAILLSLYAFFLMTPYIVITIVHIVNQDQPVTHHVLGPLIAMCVAVFAAVLLGPPLSVLLFQSSRRLLHNLTHLETIYSASVNYDLGSKTANVKTIFGDDYWMWPIPVHTAEGNGFSYSTCGGEGCSKECVMLGQKRVQVSYRRCDSPYANNGGTPCAGFNKRAVVCGGICTEGADNLATAAFQMCKADLEPKGLTVTSAKTTAYECLITCSTKTLGDIYMPMINGMPCNGGQSVCLNGKCAAVLCAGAVEAYAFHPEDCNPAPVRPVAPKPVSPESINRDCEYEWPEKWSTCRADECIVGVEDKYRQVVAEALGSGVPCDYSPIGQFRACKKQGCPRPKVMAAEFISLQVDMTPATASNFGTVQQTTAPSWNECAMKCVLTNMCKAMLYSDSTDSQACVIFTNFDQSKGVKQVQQAKFILSVPFQ